MKNRYAFLAFALSSVAFLNLAQAQTDRAEKREPEQMFLRTDVNQDESIDEAELKALLQERLVKQQDRIAALEQNGSARAEKMQARLDASSSDTMLGTPSAAAAFIIANFDIDGDWALNREEMGQAFSSIRKWRDDFRPNAS